VVVSFNSAATIRQCLEGLAGRDGIDVTVVDNASADGVADVLADLPVSVIGLKRNHGFAYACNRGWERGAAPYVLFLNPDARIDARSLEQLVDTLEADPRAGLAAPRIVDADGSLDHSLRQFARLRSTYAQALFLHRIVPRATWADEVVRDPAAYARASTAEWVSGACLLLRRHALAEVGGWDEGFFLYAEDQDLCRRLWSAGYAVLFQPAATASHVGGASAPRAGLLPVLAASRVRYAHKHRSGGAAVLERLGITLGALTHAVATDRGSAWRYGQVRAAGAALRPHAARPYQFV
jgi:GT2 family glycosyltransferase